MMSLYLAPCAGRTNFSIFSIPEGRGFKPSGRRNSFFFPSAVCPLPPAFIGQKSRVNNFLIAPLPRCSCAHSILDLQFGILDCLIQNLKSKIPLPLASLYLRACITCKLPPAYKVDLTTSNPVSANNPAKSVFNNCQAVSVSNNSKNSDNPGQKTGLVGA